MYRPGAAIIEPPCAVNCTTRKRQLHYGRIIVRYLRRISQMAGLRFRSSPFFAKSIKALPLIVVPESPLAAARVFVCAQRMNRPAAEYRLIRVMNSAAAVCTIKLSIWIFVTRITNPFVPRDYAWTRKYGHQRFAAFGSSVRISNAWSAIRQQSMNKRRLRHMHKREWFMSRNSNNENLKGFMRPRHMNVDGLQFADQSSRGTVA